MTNQATRNPTTRDVNAARRVSMALELRAQKVKYEEIAQRCGYGTPQAAHKAVMRELERTVSTNIEKMRREELDSLERLECKVWHRLEDVRYEKSMLFAVDRILAIKERRARLMGLDTPTDSAVFANQIVIREVPQGYLGEVKS